MKTLQGKVALVTGAASGIGRSLAVGLAAQGMRLCLVDIDETGLQALEAEIRASGREACSFQCDVAVYQEVLAMEKAAREKMGPVDLLINNAGIAAAGLVDELEPHEWQRVFEVNFWSVVYAVRAFLPGMIDRGEGHFVNTVSGAGVVGIPYHIQYVVSKFAVAGLTEALYSELKHAYPGIRVSMICPSYLNTRIIDRTDIRVPRRLLAAEAEPELDERMDEFKRRFWVHYNARSIPIEKAVARYIQGIRRGRLYIFDTLQLRFALMLKGCSDTLYRAVLRREGKKHLGMIAAVLDEMNIPRE